MLLFVIIFYKSFAKCKYCHANKCILILQSESYLDDELTRHWRLHKLLGDELLKTYTLV